MSLYLGYVYGPKREKPFREAWAKTGKKLDMGKSCVRFRKIEDLALDVIGETIRRVSARKFINHYESVLGNRRSRSTRKRAGGLSKENARKKSSRSARRN